MAYRNFACEALRDFSVKRASEVVTCPRCGAVWARRRQPVLLGQACPACHGYKPILHVKW